MLCYPSVACVTEDVARIAASLQITSQQAVKAPEEDEMFTCLRLSPASEGQEIDEGEEGSGVGVGERKGVMKKSSFIPYLSKLD